MEEQEAELTEALQQSMPINRLGKDTKAGKKLCKQEKALQQAQQEADSHTHAAQECISTKLAVQAQVKPLVDLAEYATYSVKAAIVLAPQRKHK